MVVFRYRSHSQSDSEGSVSSGETLHAQQAPIKCRWQRCGEWFSQLELLASHVTSQHAIPGRGGLFYCQWESCNRTDRGFNARYKMLVHMRTHTNEKPHHCFQCDKSFSRAENLKIHARSHTGERPYVCPVAGCGKAYSNSSDRFKHTRTHSVDKPYVCKVEGCNKRYTDPSSLRKHVKTYRHYPNTNIRVTKINTDDWRTNLETRLPTITSPSLDLESGKAYAPREDIQATPLIAAACYERTPIVIPNATISHDTYTEPIRSSTDTASLPYDLPAVIRSPFDQGIVKPSTCIDISDRTSPSYADQIRRSMSPPLYIEETGALPNETSLTQFPQPYYLICNYSQTPNYPQEQEMPLDLSVPH